MGEEDEAARDAIGETPEPPPELDHFLRFLVTIVDKADVEVGVTLNVGGLLVSGPLVGYAKYAEGVVSQLKEAGGSKEANEFLEEAFKGTLKSSIRTKEVMIRPLSWTWISPTFTWARPGSSRRDQPLCR
jgi:hypothetical protein